MQDKDNCPINNLHCDCEDEEEVVRLKPKENPSLPMAKSTKPADEYCSHVPSQGVKP